MKQTENRIARKDSMKILGMKVDQNLTWEEHAKKNISRSNDIIENWLW